MAFTEIDKLKAMAIVHIFETSRPFGDYAAYAVLNDGAGVSYGVNQFTHRSGSLFAVVDTYTRNGGQTGKAVFDENRALLRSASPNAIRIAAADKRLEKALKSAATTAEMRAAQQSVAFERYLRPAIEACEGSRFTTPLALAVIYDSINHGSWERIRDRVVISNRPGFEKAWITEYVRKRHEWLHGVPRLRSTAYRTAFFLTQIARQNWNLDLPLFVHGTALIARHFQTSANYPASVQTISAIDNHKASDVSPNVPPDPATDDRLPARAIPSNNETADRLDKVQKKVDRAAAAYDQLESIVRTVLTRTDAAKSLWTTVVGTIWQSVWAVASYLIGLPNEVWLVVALIVAVLMLFYLYRQFALGKIRETAGVRNEKLTNPSSRKSDIAEENYE